MVTDVGGGERDALRRTAERRLKRRYLIAASAMVVAVVGGVLTGALAYGSRDGSGVPVAVLLLVAAGVALVVAGLLFLVWAVQKRRRNAPLMLGADKATQRAVREALQRGHTDDPEVDALARDVIERSSMLRRLPWAYALFAAFFLALLLLGDRDASDVIRTAVAVTGSLVVGGAFWMQHRRHRNYRGLQNTAGQAG